MLNMALWLIILMKKIKIMTHKKSSILVTIIITFFALSSSAHHSSAPHYDREKTVDVTGDISELKLVNPHAYLYFDVEQDGEMVSWRCELSSATQLKRNGWTTEVFAPGEEIRVVGTPARREDNVCFLNQVTLSSGQTVQRNGALVEIANEASQVTEKSVN